MTNLKIIKGDITKIKTEAIVNAANTHLNGGGGVDGAIHVAAGPKLDKACKKLKGCPTGKAKITPGFNLPATYIIHTPGPIWHGGNHNEAKLLEGCYLNSLKLADQYNCKTIAFPSISTGVYGYPLNLATKIAIKTIQSFSKKIKVIIVCFDSKTYFSYQKTFKEI